MTFSIVARCSETSALGIGVSTGSPAVGNRVPHVEANVGAIATQANTNIAYGTKGLKLLKLGFSPQTSLEAMLKEDSERETRQVVIMDKNGRTAVFTGEKTPPWKGHFSGEDLVVAGNMLAGEDVLGAMKQTYERSKAGFAERILESLEAGETAGGDKRGMLSSALVVANVERRKPYTALNLRVDFSQHPTKELRKIFKEYEKVAR